MPAGHTTKMTLTPNRRELLEWIKRQPRHHYLTALGGGDKKQVHDMHRFGWVELIDGNSHYAITDAGRHQLGLPKSV